MAGGLLDDPDLIAAAAVDAGLDPEGLERWTEDPATHAALDEDIAAARSPSPSARALDHKLGGPEHERRYTAPSYELRRRDGTASASVPGFNPVQAHEAAVASIAPELSRRPQPDTVVDLLSWAEVPLATAEVVAIMQRPEAEVRTALGKSAHPIPAGADMYWSLPAKTG
jgi:hypothetical protein